MPVRDLLRPQNPLINDTSNPKTLGGPSDGTISGLLGGGLPEGSTVSIKVGGNQALKPKTGGVAATTGTTTPPTGQAGALAPTTAPTTAKALGDEGAPAGPCSDPNQEWVQGYGCMDKCKAGEIRDPLNGMQCILNPLDPEPWKACEAKGEGYKWVPTDPNNAAIGDCVYDPLSDPKFAECEAINGMYDVETGKCRCRDTDTWDKRAGMCVPKGEEGRCPDGGRWFDIPGRCVKGDELIKKKRECQAAGYTGFDPTIWECVDVGIQPEDCPKGQHRDPASGNCVDDVMPPPGEPPPPEGPGPPEDVTPPLPEDWESYYRWLFGGDDQFIDDMRYWQTQKDVISDAFSSEWLETEAQLTAAGYGYGTELQLAGIRHQRVLSMALNEAYEKIMYTAFDRKLEQQKTALQFFLGDKQLNITYALGQGQLTLDQWRLAIEESQGWALIAAQYLQIGISEQELELALFRGITERMVAEASIDQNWALVFANFLKLAIELGMAEEEAREFFDGLMDQYGHETVI